MNKTIISSFIQYHATADKELFIMLIFSKPKNMSIDYRSYCSFYYSVRPYIQL
ncbi:hypothetical protein [Eubacterium oxidoreducens]|uniref:hypothetical protein n=1 Tax=Eubacterium oxidoreducens TaxID=1732 RepID=UPI0015A2D42C|nr:hypothetical protein [Eubacterium oxidoreducens]